MMKSIEMVKKLLIISLILMVSICVAACGASDEQTAAVNESVTEETSETETGFVTGGTSESPVELGEGQNAFTFEVVNENEEDMYYTIKTDEETVGTALYNLGIVDGELGQYGLYIKYVNGELHEYDADGTYWAFYVDGEYAELSCDATPIDSGDVFTLKVEAME